MQKKLFLVTALCCSVSYCFAFNTPDISLPSFGKKDPREKEIKYLHNVQKQEEKDKFQKAKFNLKPSGYMTVEDYEALSAPKNDDKKNNVGVPKVEKPSDMKYVPRPSYRIVRYNNPPGSAEINITDTFYKMHRQNAQGIVSPDYSMMVYSAIYYYPVSNSTASELFVIPLDDAKTNMEKIQTANIVNKIKEPILSTDNTIDNVGTFRTLTPVDFSADGSKILVKEKIGNKSDGIWQTNAWVYDFTNKTSYNLLEVRDAIIYYWKEKEGLNLDDKRWDIYPLGFDLNEPERVIVNALAYTGNSPVNLGTWSINFKGEQSRLISFDNSSVKISMNGLKIVQDGFVPKTISEAEEEQMKKNEKLQAKEKEKAEKAEIKAIDSAEKQRMKELNSEYKQERNDYRTKLKINGTTSFNDAADKYIEVKAKQDEKAQKLLEKKKQKELKRLEKLKKKEEKIKTNQQ